MHIRHRLSLVFLIAVAVLLGCSFVTIYLLSAEGRKSSYYDRLDSRARTTARLLIEVEEVDSDLLLIIDKNTPGILPFERVVVFDFRNEQIYDTEENDLISLPQELFDQIRIEETVHFSYQDFESLGIRYAHPEGVFVVIAMARDVYGLRRLQKLQQILWIVFAISLILSAALGWYVSGRALQPIKEVVKRVRMIGATNLHTRVEVKNASDEIGKMAQTFNEMLDRLEAAFVMQKQFIGNASHELRTPLTSMIGQLEVAQLQLRSIATYQELLASILDDIRRMQKLLSRLMLLAQAQSELPRESFNLLRLDDLIWQVREDLLRFYPAYQMEVTFDSDPLEESSLCIEGHEELVFTALMNLAENGCKYAPDHRVILHVDFLASGISLTFINKGVIHPEDLPHIFQPFYRSKSPTGQPGNGLGLPLARQIFTLHGGNLDVDTSTPAYIKLIAFFPYAGLVHES